MILVETRIVSPTISAVLVILFLHPLTALSQAARISIDGVFSDWDNLTPFYVDAAGDQTSGDLDFGRLWCANDERFLFLRVEVGAEINIQNDNDITIFIDTDNNSSSGKQVYGIGAELEWNFGPKDGLFVTGTDSLSIFHSNIGLVTAPTVTSTQFEITFDRNAQPDGQTPLFPANTIRIVLADGGVGGDLLPDDSGGVVYTIDNTPVAPPPLIALQKMEEDHLRFLSYNVLVDGLFKPESVPSYERILGAIKPDIIGFQEIHTHSAEETANQVESMLPSMGEEQWYSSKVAPDIIAVSRYPISNTFAIEENGAFLINLRPKYDTDLFLIVAHPPCCENNEGRQREIDAMMAFIRDAKEPGGVLDLVPNTPILIIGDLNLVGDSQQQKTVLRGDIVNEAEFGPAFAPDWDGSDFTDLLPRQTHLLMTYTWYRETSIFSPGRLDYMVYSESVIDVGNHFILFTPEMSPDSLAAYDLLEDDVTTASDHLPVVSDFILPVQTDIRTTGSTVRPGRFALGDNYPNPFNSSTTIQYEVSDNARVQIRLYDILGQHVATLIDEERVAGRYEVVWDGRRDDGDRLGSGVYVYQLQVLSNDGRRPGEIVATKKLVLLQ